MKTALMHSHMINHINTFIRTAVAVSMIFLVSASAGAQKKISIVAHRGFWKCEAAGDAENSIASLREAQKIAVWGSEFDVHHTGDRKLLVNHDNTRGGKEIELTELDFFTTDESCLLKNGEHPSTLDQYLKQGEASDKTILVFEFKTSKNCNEDMLVRKSVRSLKNHGLFNPSRVMFISGSRHICEVIAKKYPQFTNQYLKGDIAPKDLKAVGINGIDYRYLVLRQHPEWVAEAHALGMSVNCWTVNTAEDIQEMIDLGVDSITTNEPLLVRDILGSRELLNL